MFKRLSVLSLLSAFVLAGCADDSSPTGVDAVAEGRADAPGQNAGPTIADIASEAAADEDSPQFTVLVAALSEAGLVDVLDGKGQFTVFAPTDEAFGRLLSSLDLTAEELLADTDLLTDVLLYHVARGRRLSGDVLDSDQIRTLQGGFIFPRVADEGAFIADTNAGTEDAQLLVDAGLIDIEASNGVIHVIDEVLLFGDEDPRKDREDDDEYDDEEEEDEELEDLTIAQAVERFATAEEGAEFTILFQALQNAELVAALNDDDDELTVFAPTDAAFGRLLELLDVSAEDLLADTGLLTDVLLYHVAPGELFSGDVLAAESIETLQGGVLTPLVDDGGAFIVDGNEATENAQLLVDAGLIDLEVENGVIHVIDEVLLFDF